MNLRNKVSIEFDFPVSDDAKFCEDVIVQQTEHLVEFWRDVLARYKAKGITVPTLYVKYGKVKPVSASATEYKDFSNKLLEHHLHYMPKDNVAAQRKVIKQLYATGKSANELIELYEESRDSYKLTSWFTVKYNLTRPDGTLDIKPEFERKALSEEEQQSIINRLKNEVQ